MKHDKRNPKVVFILGAGFSVPAGFPTQSGILENLYRTKSPSFGSSDEGGTQFTLPGQFERDLNLVKKFIDDIWGMNTFPRLEDVFTLLDHSIVERKSCKTYSWLKVFEVDLAFRRTLLFYFHHLSQKAIAGPKETYKKFVQLLLQKRELVSQMVTSEKNLQFSVISLNWDDLLDELFYREIRRKKQLLESQVDYCCFTVPLDSESPHIRSFHQKPLKIRNIKLLKLHGSINWLICPNCDRIYTGVGAEEKRWSKYAFPDPCSCQLPGGLKNDDATYSLQPFFITPTYLKTFGNSHIQSIWSNAYSEIAEATKIVFIGYSLPEADYPLRSLLVRAIRPDTEIEVVLAKSDICKRNTPTSIRSAYASERFKLFFPQFDISFYDTGLDGYVTSGLAKTLRTRHKTP